MDLPDLGCDGVFSVREAALLGLGPVDLHRLTRRGQIARLARAHYTCRTDTIGEERHLLRTIAHVRSYGARAAASHHSALLVTGMPLYDVPLTQVRLTRTGPGQRRNGPTLAVDPPAGPTLTVRGPRAQGGLLCVPLEVAIVQTGCLHGPVSALVAADAALRQKRLRPEALLEACTTLTGHSGVARVRELIRFADARHESPGETRLAHVLRVLGVSATPQIIVADGAQEWRVDVMLDDVPVVVEFDGLSKYRSRDDLVREKHREDRLRELGYEVVRFTWHELDDVALVRSRIGAAVARVRTLARAR